MPRTPICILGAGPAGRNYIKHACRDWRLDVVGFTNRSENRRQAVEAETGVPGFADLQSLLDGAETRPQMVVIATANPTHKRFTIEALEAGLDVFCEKPMAMNLADCREILAAEKRTGKQLQIGFEYRYGSMTGRLKELQDDDFFGDLRSIDITDSRGHWWPDHPDTRLEEVWRLNPDIGGGPILHCGIHELDLLRYYAGEVEELQAFVPPRSISYYPEHAPDHLNIQFRHSSGATSSFTLYHNIAGTWYRTRHQPTYHKVPGHGLDIVMSGAKGSAICEIYKCMLHLNRFDDDAKETLYLRSESFEHHDHNTTHHDTPDMIATTAQRFATGKGPLHSAEDSYRTTCLGFAADRAVQEALSDGWSSSRIKVEVP